MYVCVCVDRSTKIAIYAHQNNQIKTPTTFLFCFLFSINCSLFVIVIEQKIEILYNFI